MSASMALAEVNLPDLLPPFDVDVDPATGAASYNFPLPLPVGRLGFGPGLALTYAHGAGNSPYGFGWTLAGLSSVTVYDRREHPRYDGTDRYAFAGEELVPAVRSGPGGATLGWEWDTATHHVRRFRSRHESTSNRVEQWTRRADGDVHWRVRRPDGGVAVFGRRVDGSSRVRDPRDHTRVYEWLLDAQYDRFGNAIRYEWAPEDGAGVDWSEPAEQSRRPTGSGPVQPLAQRLLKRVRYTNDAPLGVDDDDTDATWCFEVVVDYGDHTSADAPQTDADQSWPVRADPYSSCRPGYDVRTYRLASRFLVFHRFAELGAEPVLVRSVDLTHRPSPASTWLTGLTVRGFRHDGGATTTQTLPTLRFGYSGADGAVVEDRLRNLDRHSCENLPQGLHGSEYRWVDLRGEGVNGILSISDGAWWYKPNLGGGRFGTQERLPDKPSTTTTGAVLSDFDRDGNFDLAVLDGTGAGSSQLDRETQTWSPFVRFASTPVLAGPGRQDWVDVDGDGRPDAVLARADRSLAFPSLGRDGFGPPAALPVSPAGTAAAAPPLAERAELGVFLADMSGDGALDVVHIQDGRVEYWPGLGGGALGEPILMRDPPRLPDGRPLDARRLRFVDLDATGTADLLYLDEDTVRWWINASGNRFVPGGEVTGLPVTDDLTNAQVIDLLADGTLCLVWSSALAQDAKSPIRYLRLMADGPPGRLVSVASDGGGETVLEYSSSAAHYRRDEASDEPWLTRLPSHVTVVDRKITIDHVAGTRSITRLEYHCGYFDSTERLFRGFLCVDVHDSGSFHRTGWGSPDVTTTGPPGPDELPPEELGAASCHRVWHSPGAPDVAARLATRFWSGDPASHPVASGPEQPIADPSEDADANSTLAGRVIRDELFAVDADGSRHPVPISVESSGYRIRRLQPAVGNRPAVFTAHRREDLHASYEEDPTDPRVEQRLVLESDDFGVDTLVLDLGCPRRSDVPADDPSQAAPVAALTRTRVAHVDDDDSYQAAIPVSEEMFEGRGIGDTGPLDLDAAAAAVGAALAAPLENGDDFTAGTQLRRTSWEQTRYRDAGRTNALGLGDVGPERLVHHERHACFSDDKVTRVYGTRVDAAMLMAAGYVHDAGYWWATGPVARLLPTDQFSLPVGSVEADGSAVSWDLDDHLLLRKSATDAVGAATTAGLDYQALAPHTLTDANGSTIQARYDAFGVAVLTSVRGTILDDAGTVQRYGARPVAEHTTDLPATLAAAITDPVSAVGPCSSYRYLDTAAWRERREPPCTVEVVREDLVDDGTGGVHLTGRTQVVVAHHDGLGRVVQSKTLVDPGPAVARGPDGVLLTDAAGNVTFADAAVRWRASGHVVWDSKQQAVLEYEPFHTGTPAYEPDPLLQTFGVAVRSRYDAAGRLTGTDFPNGTRATSTIGAWSTVTADPNDTVTGSGFELQRTGLPADDPQRRALERARAHAGTPTTMHRDPLGREVLGVHRGAGGEERRTRTVLDDDGSPVAVIDARGLTVTRHDYDMASRVLRRVSVDAGELVVLHDAQDRDVRHWDGRGFQTTTSYDAADRPTTVRVTGGPDQENHVDQVVERYTYGEDLGVPQAKARNAFGLLVIVEDAAGRHETERFTPAAQPLRVSHRLRAEVEEDPDWAAPGGVALEAATFTCVTGFDALGRPVSRTSPDGTTATYGYLQSGVVETISVSTDDGRVADVPVLSAATDNARGQQHVVTLGNGVVTTYDYDPETAKLSHATTVAPTAAGGAPVTVSDVEVVRDPVGNITWIVDHAQEPANPTPLLQGLTITPVREFRYDPYYQLTEATGRVHQALLPEDAWTPAAGVVHGARHLALSNGAAVERYTQTYSYDLAGNLAQIRHAGVSRSWNQDMWVSATSNRRLPALDANGHPIADGEARFDPCGNTVSLPHLAALRWDHRNQLRTATIIDRSAAGQPDDVEHYVYDAGGNRVRKVTDRLTAGGVERTEKIYLDGCELLRRTRGGVSDLERSVALVGDDQHRYAAVYRWTSDAGAAETDDTSIAEVRYLVPDHLGSTLLELDQHGGVVTYEEQFPYGGSTFLAGNEVRRARLRDRRYTGKERDEATGLYYYGYRYYAPWIGGWLSPDPAGPTSSLNLYEFVNGNPVNLVDPDGLDPDPQSAPDPVLGVPASYTREQALRAFNNGAARELGYRALDMRREGNNWVITRGEYYTPQFRQFVDEMQGKVEAAGVAADIEKMFDELNLSHKPPPGSQTKTDTSSEDPPAQTDSRAPVAKSGGTNAEAPPTGDREKGNASRADGSTDSGRDPGSGTAVTGNGTGNGTKGAGVGGGGTGETVRNPNGTGQGPGPGTEPGTEPGSGGGTGETNREGDPQGTGTDPTGPGATRAGGKGTNAGGTGPGTGTDNGVPGGVPGGQPGGNVDAASSGSVDGALVGNTTESADGAGATPTTNGAPNATADGTGRDATGQASGRSADPTHHGPGPGTSGRPRNPGAGGGHGPTPNAPRPTLLDKITHVAGYWHLESGGDGGVSGGIPGGMGSLSGWGAQLAYLALTVADIVATIVTLGELKAALVGLKASIKAALKNAVKQGFKKTIGNGWRALSRAVLRMWRGGSRRSTPLWRRIQRFFWEDRKSFGMWRDFRIRYGIPKNSGWSMEHMIIKQRWYRGATAWFPKEHWVSRALQTLGDAGWNVVPMRLTTNGWLYRHGVISAMFNHGFYTSGIERLHDLWHWATSPPSSPAPAAAPAATTSTHQTPAPGGTP